jgi:hypothetical protein
MRTRTSRVPLCKMMIDNLSQVLHVCRIVRTRVRMRAHGHCSTLFYSSRIMHMYGRRTGASTYVLTDVTCRNACDMYIHT